MPAAAGPDMMVVGAGPAGAAVALGLARLGYRVVVAGVPRRFAACEGVSERVLKGLAGAGLAAALADLAPPSARAVNWNGETRAANTERLLAREAFDRALWRELGAAGIARRPARVDRIEPLDEGGVRVHCGTTALHARLVVDARGRGAARGAARERGPETVSLLQRWRGPAGGAAASCVTSFADGWAWLARTADGTRYTQLTLGAATPGLPKRSGLGAWLRTRLEALPEARAWVAGCVLDGAAAARSSTAILQSPLFARGVLRVGDAAMAVDPLSGNGIFQALSTALVAPAVINTLLVDGANAPLALGFYEARVRHLFERFARIGRDFYRSETRWAEAPFWRQRAAWPDDEPAHDTVAPRLLGTACRAVVDHGLIREREVLLTSDQPLGVWRVADVELAPLLAGLPGEAPAREAALAARIDGATRGNAVRAQALRAWLRRSGFFL